RLGDAADMCIIEFVDFNDVYTLGAVTATGDAKPKTRRSHKPTAKGTDAVEDATIVDGEKASAKKAAPQKVAAQKTVKPTASKSAGRVAAPKAVKKTNVGKKM
ncbi:MAG: 50S ribosomal protein L17, partial [Alistipes sp.]